MPNGAWRENVSEFRAWRQLWKHVFREEGVTSVVELKHQGAAVLEDGKVASTGCRTDPKIPLSVEPTSHLVNNFFLGFLYFSFRLQFLGLSPHQPSLELSEHWSLPWEPWPGMPLSQPGDSSGWGVTGAPQAGTGTSHDLPCSPGFPPRARVGKDSCGRGPGGRGNGLGSLRCHVVLWLCFDFLVSGPKQAGPK